MKRGSTILTIIALGLLIIPLISAYSLGGGYYRSPLDYLENEWVIFSIVFMIFFAVIFFSVNRSFKNPGVSTVIALGLSLLIAMVMARRGMLYGYVGEELGSWIMIITILMGTGFIIRFAYESFGRTGVIVALAILWAVFRGIDVYDILPYQLLTETFVRVYEFITGIVGGIVIIIIAIIFMNVGEERETGIERLLRPKRRRSFSLFKRR